MSDLLTTLMERVGRTSVPRYAREAFGYKSIVQYTSEFKRIENLSRRQWNIDTAALLTKELSSKHGLMKLWSIQAIALTEIVLNNGAFLPIGVGQGKALISLLSATVLKKCKRPVLFVPAELREQTKKHVLPEMSKHWNIRKDLRIIGYSELSLAKNSGMLEVLKPDLIILDECHYLKNKRSGRTRRVARYFHDNPLTVCVAMSGTVSNRSLRDFAHILQWCLKDYTPLPMTWNELSLWADALDTDIDDSQRAAPGALMRFCKDDENARQGFRRRLVETPGVVASKESDLGVSLRIVGKNPLIPESINKMLAHMRNTWETPNGDIITEAIDLWRHMRELSLGFWYKWEPTPPRDWLDARKEWKSLVRTTISHSRKNFDTELQVWNWYLKNKPEDLVFKEWRGIKDAFKINTVAEWVSDFALQECKKWLWENNGICWVEHTAFGKKLEETSVYTYYGASNSSIIDTDETSIIASVQSHGTGKNLQRYSKNLIVCPSTSGKTWEQILGRTHREGQKENEVICDVFLHTKDFMDAFNKARMDARYLEDTLGNRQKLNYADLVI